MSESRLIDARSFPEFESDWTEYSCQYLLARAKLFVMDVTCAFSNDRWHNRIKIFLCLSKKIDIGLWGCSEKGILMLNQFFVFGTNCKIYYTHQ